MCLQAGPPVGHYRGVKVACTSLVVQLRPARRPSLGAAMRGSAAALLHLATHAGCVGFSPPKVGRDTPASESHFGTRHTLSCELPLRCNGPAQEEPWAPSLVEVQAVYASGAHHQWLVDHVLSAHCPIRAESAVEDLGQLLIWCDSDFELVGQDLVARFTRRTGFFVDTYYYEWLGLGPLGQPPRHELHVPWLRAVIYPSFVRGHLVYVSTAEDGLSITVLHLPTGEIAEQALVAPPRCAHASFWEVPVIAGNALFLPFDCTSQPSPSDEHQALLIDLRF